MYAHAQIPAGYYSTATGTGYALKTQLYNKIRNHTIISYAGLWTLYSSSDRDNQYENDNTIFDYYSENPAGTDPVTFLYSTNQCGSYTAQGQCYNREHVIPQSIFASASPMVSDAHFIIPVDGYVNGIRSDNPHGNVSTATFTSLNGSKRGSSAVSGFIGTVFEPLNDFKGDIARMYFYFVTRYENLVSSYTTYPMFNGTSNQAFSNAFLTMLISWHNQDPVSAHEIVRNNAIYAQQNNRNPFIDHPEYVGIIWGGSTSNVAQTITFNSLPNLIYGNSSINLTATASSGLTINYMSSNTNVATISGNVLNVVGVGTVTITASQSGDSVYSATQSVGQTFTVTAKPIMVTATANNKVYDGNANATITGTLNGIVGSDIVIFNGIGTFASANIGTGILVTSSSTITGAQAGNYSLTQPTGLSANIIAASTALLRWNTFGNTGLEIAEPSTYNDNNLLNSNINATGSTIVLSSNSNRLGGNNWAVGSLSATKYLQFVVTPNANISFTPTSFDFIWDFSSTGPSGIAIRSSIDGYTNNLGSMIGMTASTSAVKSIPIAGLVNVSTPTTFRLYGFNATGASGTGGFDCAVNANNIILNGTTSIIAPPTIVTMGTLTTLSTVYGTASLSTSFTVSAANMNDAILVTAPTGYEVSLTSGGNYSSSLLVGSAGTIASTVVYIRLSTNTPVGIYSGNVVLTSAGATTINVATSSSIVNPKGISVGGVTANNKFFDGNTNATLSGIPFLVGVLAVDITNVILFGTPAANFINASVGNSVAVTIAGYSIAGTASSNYMLIQPTGLSANIIAIPVPMITSVLTASSVYGMAASIYTIGATQSPASYNASGLPNGLIINSATGEISGTAFDIPGVYTINISATNSSGTGSANLVYTVLPKPLTITGCMANNKSYDGTLAATISNSTLVGLVGNDVVTVSASGNFVNSNAANGILVSSTQVLSGVNALNYSLVLPTNLSANIIPAIQTISFNSLPNKMIGDASFALTATGGASGNAITYTSSNSLVATISGSIVTIVGVGTTNIIASQAGNANYLAANNITRTLVVTSAVIAAWDFSVLSGGTGLNNYGVSPYSATYNIPNSFIGGLTRGAGVGTSSTSTAAARAWGGTNNTATSSSAINTNTAITFTLKPSTGYAMDLDAITPIDYRRSATGATNALVQYSINGGGIYTDLATLNLTNSTSLGASAGAIDLSNISALKNIHASQEVIVRIVPYGGTGGTFYFFDRAVSSAYDLAVLGNVRVCAPSSSSSTLTISASATPYSWNGQSLSVSGTYTNTLINSLGCDSIVTLNLTVLPSSALLTVKAFLQGFYLSNSTMNAVLFSEGESADTTICDSVKIALHNNTFPYTLAYSQTGMITINGLITCAFPAASIGNAYYIVVKHRNTIETWSNNAILLNASTSYDFSTAVTQAFGNNLIEVESNVWGIYAGDISQDGSIDNTDFSIWENDANVFSIGHLASDIDGNGSVDNADFSIWEINAANFVGVMKP
jgi:endonuclease I